MIETEDQNSLFFKWPKLSNEEIAKFYLDIKQNKVIKLSWNSPGRIDPKDYDEKHSKKIEEPNMNEIIQTEPQTETTNQELVENCELNQKFDLFDEFNDDDEMNANQVLKLTHVKKCSESDKKMASIDKILNDIRKKYQFEQNSSYANENNEGVLGLVNDKFLNENYEMNQQHEENLSEINNKNVNQTSNFELIESDQNSDLNRINMENFISTSLNNHILSTGDLIDTDLDKNDEINNIFN
ncbi:unnamed protein product [Brachionus calyciflorus]|uniref:Uncharacterized protein n=1 Tax=Brachionus calyciflorus TaxID=104777 RepID=A0A813TC89_9BILA|nr:unnamed protein product [Brachionus calyciflorus]